MLLFALAISLLTSVLFGLVPAMQSGAGDLNDALRDSARGSSAGLHRTRLRSALVASEFALALMLLVGAGLMIRSFRALQQIDAGFDPHGVATMVVSVKGSKQEDPALRTAFYRSIVERVAALPGVQGASAINHLPIAGDMWGWPYAIEGRPAPKPGEELHGTYRVVLPGYFRTMRIPVLRGRDVSEEDRPRHTGRRRRERGTRDALSWPGEDPIGKRITVDPSSAQPQWLTVVGVVKNAVRMEWTEKPEAEFYLPYLKNGLLDREPELLGLVSDLRRAHLRRPGGAHRVDAARRRVARPERPRLRGADDGRGGGPGDRALALQPGTAGDLCRGRRSCSPRSASTA